MFYFKELINFTAFKPDIYDEKFALKDRVKEELTFCASGFGSIKVGTKKPQGKWENVQEFAEDQAEFWSYLETHAKNKLLVLGSSVNCILSEKEGDHNLTLLNNHLKLKTLQKDIKEQATLFEEKGYKIVRMYPIMIAVASKLAVLAHDKKVSICASNGDQMTVFLMDKGVCHYYQARRIPTESNVREKLIEDIKHTMRDFEGEFLGYGMTERGKTFVEEIFEGKSAEISQLTSIEHLELEVLAHDF